MLKPYTFPSPPIKDVLNPVHTDDADIDASLLYSQTVKNTNNPRFKNRKQNEYDGTKGKVGVILYNSSDLPPNPNIIVNRFILSIKDPEMQFVRLKARWILPGHTDALRHDIANNSHILIHLTYCIIISFSLIFSLLVLGFAMLNKPICKQAN